jgi:hypothetical protein
VSALALIDAARAEGLTLGVEGGNLVVEVDHDPPGELLAQLREHKAAIITELRGGDPDWSPPDDLDERAAIIAEGACVPRAWAEGFAALCAMPPPVGFWSDRWQRIIDATGVFLDRWAAEAIRCGWSDLDVFGCHDTAPTARRDAMGLLMLLDSCEVTSIDAEVADLVTAGGARQRFYRRPLPPGTVSLWELAGMKRC